MIRVLDIILAGGAIIVFFPIMIAMCLILLATQGYPIFYTQERIGKNGHPFSIIKFRTMKSQASHHPVKHANKDDHRITPVGRVLRDINLDEIAQLWNVICGDMSLVGPRPHAQAHDREFNEQIKNYHVRYKVKPGITGLAQVNGAHGPIKCQWDIVIRSRLDNFYVRRQSVCLYFYVLLLTSLMIVRVHRRAKPERR